MTIRRYPGGWGGALVPEEVSSPKFYNCTFEENFAVYGGAIDDGGTSSASFYGCTFFNNSANYGGIHKRL